MLKEFEPIGQIEQRKKNLSLVLGEANALVSRVGLKYQNMKEQVGTSLDATIDYGKYHKSTVNVRRVAPIVVERLTRRSEQFDQEAEPVINTLAQSYIERVNTTKPKIDELRKLKSEGHLTEDEIGSHRHEIEEFDELLKLPETSPLFKKSLDKIKDKDGSAEVKITSLAVQESSNRVVPAKQPATDHSILPLDADQRTRYKQEIAPFVEAARQAFKPMHEAREKFRLNGRSDFHKASQNNPAITKDIRENFRVKANDLIAKASKLKSEHLVSAGVNPMEIALHRNPQISPAETANAFIRPNSPVRPHNSLTRLAIYRENRVNQSLVRSLMKASADLMPSNPKAMPLSLAMVNLIPQHFMGPNKSIPQDLRRKEELAKDIVRIADLVLQFDSGELMPPTEEELGSITREQDDHIISYLRSLLAFHLKEEISNPNRTEMELQDFYQKMSNFIRVAARHITPRHGREEESYERIGSLIEDMPGLEGPMLSTRLSTNLYMDLGLPCLEYTEEVRIAEIIRNIGSSGFRKYDRDDHSISYELPEKSIILLGKITDSIHERMELGDIDLFKLFSSLESLDYGDQVIRNILKASDLDQRNVLTDALNQTSCFKDKDKLGYGTFD